MRTMHSAVFILLAAIVISGCVPRDLDPGADRILVVSNPKNYALNSCKLLGQISESDVHKYSMTSSMQRLELDDINFLKNEGRKLGANIVVFNQHRIIVVTRESFLPKRHKKKYSKHSINGSAYWCPPDIIAKIR